MKAKKTAARLGVKAKLISMQMTRDYVFPLFLATTIEEAKGLFAQIFVLPFSAFLVKIGAKPEMKTCIPE